MNLVIFGPPGSGKGTQAERIKSRFELAHVSTGDLLRAAVASQSDLGRKVEGILAAGELVSDGIVLELIREAVTRVGNDESVRGWLLDGFPRTRGQAEGLGEIVAAVGQKIDAIVVLEVPREAIVERLAARGRTDDTPETVMNRLDVYEEATAPILDYYEGKVSIHRVNGDQPIEAVTEAIERLLT